MVLSILAENTKGLNAYQLLKEFREKFSPVATPSPGTIYPLLEKMVINKEILKDKTLDPPIFLITPFGKKRLTEGIPDILNSSLESLPIILENLIRNLPFNIRVQFMSNFPQSFCGCKSCHPPEDESENSDNDPIPSTVKIDRLNKVKNSLEESKKRIEEWSQKELANINNRIQKIEEKIKEIELARTKYKKIPIDSTD